MWLHCRRFTWQLVLLWVCHIHITVGVARSGNVVEHQPALLANADDTVTLKHAGSNDRGSKRGSSILYTARFDVFKGSMWDVVNDCRKQTSKSCSISERWGKTPDVAELFLSTFQSLKVGAVGVRSVAELRRESSNTGNWTQGRVIGGVGLTSYDSHHSSLGVDAFGDTATSDAGEPLAQQFLRLIDEKALKRDSSGNGQRPVSLLELSTSGDTRPSLMHHDGDSILVTIAVPRDAVTVIPEQLREKFQGPASQLSVVGDCRLFLQCLSLRVAFRDGYVGSSGAS